jgi:hypothetical protein
MAYGNAINWNEWSRSIGDQPVRAGNETVARS